MSNTGKGTLNVPQLNFSMSNTESLEYVLLLSGLQPIHGGINVSPNEAIGLQNLNSLVKFITGVEEKLRLGLITVLPNRVSVEASIGTNFLDMEFVLPRAFNTQKIKEELLNLLVEKNILIMEKNCRNGASCCNAHSSSSESDDTKSVEEEDSDQSWDEEKADSDNSDDSDEEREITHLTLYYGTCRESQKMLYMWNVMEKVLMNDYRNSYVAMTTCMVGPELTYGRKGSMLPEIVRLPSVVCHGTNKVCEMFSLGYQNNLKDFITFLTKECGLVYEEQEDKKKIEPKVEKKETKTQNTREYNPFEDNVWNFEQENNKNAPFNWTVGDTKQEKAKPPTFDEIFAMPKKSEPEPEKKETNNVFDMMYLFKDYKKSEPEKKSEDKKETSVFDMMSLFQEFMPKTKTENNNNNSNSRLTDELLKSVTSLLGGILKTGNDAKEEKTQRQMQENKQTTTNPFEQHTPNPFEEYKVREKKHPTKAENRWAELQNRRVAKKQPSRNSQDEELLETALEQVWNPSRENNKKFLNRFNL